MLSLFFITSCEKAEIQKSLTKDDQKIESRMSNCNQCPVSDCCCELTLLSGSAPTIQMCGTSSPDLSDTECDLLINGCAATGHYKTAFLNDTTLFCMPINTAFSLRSSTSSVIRVSCQFGQTSPQYTDVTIGASGTTTVFVNGSCEVDECP
jgi:hypothetical protein